MSPVSRTILKVQSIRPEDSVGQWEVRYELLASASHVTLSGPYGPRHCVPKCMSSRIRIRIAIGPSYSGSDATEDVRQSRIPSDMSTQFSVRHRCASSGNSYDAGGTSESTQEDSFWLRAMQTAESEGKQVGRRSDHNISRY